MFNFIKIPKKFTSLQLAIQTHRPNYTGLQKNNDFCAAEIGKVLNDMLIFS